VTVTRVMGIETEYGILSPGLSLNPVAASALAVTSYFELLPGGRTRTPRWDYSDEDPLADARGFRLDRAAAHPSQLTDDPNQLAPGGPVTGSEGLRGAGFDLVAVETSPSSVTGTTSSVLPNGARLYVDHAHPEYSTPEVTGPDEALIWDRAGELIMERACAASRQVRLAAYKNNTDGKGATYGTHENYLVDRAVPFGDLVALLIPFLVTRTIVTGSGRVGLGRNSEGCGFQLAQRADYIESEAALETTFNRPIVNTRDEPHADRTQYRRLHLILGDANCFDVPTYLKLGTTAAVLWLAEHAQTHPNGPAAAAVRQLTCLSLAEPVQAVRQVSYDLDLTGLLKLADGRRMRALDIQEAFALALDRAITSVGEDPTPDLTADVLGRWRSVLHALATDVDSAAPDVEWVAKRQLLEAKRLRDQTDWTNPSLAAIDLQWSAVGNSIAGKLRDRGGATVLVDPADVAAAVNTPPATTRAWLRGQLVGRYRAAVTEASWDGVLIEARPGEFYRLRLPDPRKGSAADVGEVFADDPDVVTALARLSRSGEQAFGAEHLD
jgi:proteasome accessory factor PafA2